jgi:hypothetical protein
MELDGGTGPADPNSRPQENPALTVTGKIEGDAAGSALPVQFTAGGYTGTAKVYYAVTARGGVVPAYTAFTGSLGSFPAGSYTGQNVTLPQAGAANYQPDGKYSVYALLLKGGKLSARVKLTPLIPEPVPGADGYVGSIKDKFGIAETGKAGVEAAFTTLSKYIKGGGLSYNEIKLGDWIDLEAGLTVEAYNGSGDFTETNADLGAHGKLLRLIVVGINSFRSGRGMKSEDRGLTVNGESNGRYAVTANNGVDHVVFQFQNVPVLRPMNASDTIAGGYAASEMRKYLAPTGNSGSGRFLAGLVQAGVPQNVMWAPVRHISTRGADGTVQDLLWLPTEREIFGTNMYSEESYETRQNQARLEYYTSDTLLMKYDKNNILCWYPEASPHAGTFFCFVHSLGIASFYTASTAGGCAPAFCVY